MVLGRNGGEGILDFVCLDADALVFDFFGRTFKASLNASFILLFFWTEASVDVRNADLVFVDVAISHGEDHGVTKSKCASGTFTRDVVLSGHSDSHHGFLSISDSGAFNFVGEGSCGEKCGYKSSVHCQILNFITI